MNNPDDRRPIRDDHSPTPFTAEEIRSASVAGYAVETVTEHDGVVVSRHRTEFTDVDAEGAMMVTTPIDADGAVIGDPRATSAAWTELQAHASFPAAITTITDETIDTPLGTLACLRYEVRGGDHTNVFWFSPAHPGMPVRFTSDAEHGPTTSVVAVHRPA